MNTRIAALYLVASIFWEAVQGCIRSEGTLPLPALLVQHSQQLISAPSKAALPVECLVRWLYATLFRLLASLRCRLLV